MVHFFLDKWPSKFKFHKTKVYFKNLTTIFIRFAFSKKYTTKKWRYVAILDTSCICLCCLPVLYSTRRHRSCLGTNRESKIIRVFNIRHFKALKLWIVINTGQSQSPKEKISLSAWSRADRCFPFQCEISQEAFHPPVFLENIVLNVAFYTLSSLLPRIGHWQKMGLRPSILNLLYWLWKTIFSVSTKQNNTVLNINLFKWQALSLRVHLKIERFGVFLTGWFGGHKGQFPRLLLAQCLGFTAAMPCSAEKQTWGSHM